MTRAAASCLASIAALSAALAGCATAETPAWFEARRAELDSMGTPDLKTVPRGTAANTDAAHWARVEAEIAAAEAAIETHPRSQIAREDAAATDPAFEDAARQALEATSRQY